MINPFVLLFPILSTKRLFEMKDDSMNTVAGYAFLQRFSILFSPSVGEILFDRSLIFINEFNAALTSRVPGKSN